MVTRFPIFVAVAIALVAAAVFAARPSPVPAAQPTLVAASYRYTFGFIHPCGFTTVGVTVRRTTRPALLRRIDQLLPAHLPQPVRSRAMPDGPGEWLLLQLAGGRSYTYSGGGLPRSLARAVTVLRQQVHGPCRP
jgi:hypothetical protein